jgi:FixJ family two-component response regulator
MSPLAQRRRSFVVQSLPSSTCTSHDILYSRPFGQRHLDEYEEMLADNRVTGVADQVAFRLDFKAWLRRLTSRERKIIKAMIREERTKDIAQEFGLSEGRISQLRRQFEECWRAFVGDEGILMRRPLKSRKKRVRA